ncbi:MAG TPA: Gfo/Idh/MocA family oxidoreductase [Gemmatales bacterium]|nr:Gfo/Idh/MocA family oxidoreductase [Gemmatales bacterium]
MPASRRTFLAASAASMTGAVLAAHTPAVHTGGTDTLKVGLIGCGGRGTGAATQAVSAGPGITLTAMGDLFADQLEASKSTLKGDIGDRFQVKPENCFVGFDAYQGVLNSGVDLVCLASPPHFRPAHLEAAVKAGVHIFCEKPMAVDAPGARRVLAAAAEAKQKRLALVSGFCWRYHDAVREAMRRVHDGAIGDIVAMQCTYNTGLLWHKARQPAWSDMEWQCRNWLYFTWLSGDHNVEQHIHSLDKLAWAMKDQHPLQAVGMGGRQVRTDPAFGHIFDHHAVVYEFAEGVRGYAFCRQQAGTHRDVSDVLMGTKGQCFINGSSGASEIRGAENWRFDQRKLRTLNMYQQEHNELVASIRRGEPINDGEWMTQSTQIGILGRMATYTGQLITWDQAWNSQEYLTPAKYEFGPIATPPVAMPGATKFS